MTPPRTRARTYALFEKRFRPIPREDGSLLRDHAELPARETIQRREWWTVLDCDGRLYLSAGFRFVNRLGYVLCEVPWSDADQLIDYRYD